MKLGTRKHVDAQMLLITPTCAGGEPLHDGGFWADRGVQHVLLMSPEHVADIVRGVRVIYNWGNPIAWAKLGMRVGLMARPPHRQPSYGTATIAEVLVPGPLPPNRRGPGEPWTRDHPRHPQYVGDYAVWLEEARPL